MIVQFPFVKYIQSDFLFLLASMTQHFQSKKQNNLSFMLNSDSLKLSFQNFRFVLIIIIIKN